MQIKHSENGTMLESHKKFLVYAVDSGLGQMIKDSACNAGSLGSIPGSGRSPGEGPGNLLQYSCLEDSMDRGAGRATVHRVTKSRT